jgi:hypothetical protein
LQKSVSVEHKKIFYFLLLKIKMFALTSEFFLSSWQLLLPNKPPTAQGLQQDELSKA